MSSPRYFSEKVPGATAPRGIEKISGSGEPLKRKRVELKTVKAFDDVGRIPESTEATQAKNDRREFVHQPSEDEALFNVGRLQTPAERLRAEQGEDDQVVVKLLRNIRGDAPQQKESGEIAHRVFTATEAREKQREQEVAENEAAGQRAKAKLAEITRKGNEKLAEQVRQAKESQERMRAAAEKAKAAADARFNKARPANVPPPIPMEGLVQSQKLAEKNRAREITEELSEEFKTVLNQTEQLQKTLEKTSTVMNWDQLQAEVRNLHDRMTEARQNSVYNKKSHEALFDQTSRAIEKTETALFQLMRTEKEQKIQDRVAKESEAAIDREAMNEFVEDLEALRRGPRRVEDSTNKAQQSVDAYWNARVEVQKYLAESGEKVAPRELANAQAKAKKAANETVQREIEARMNPKERAWAAETRQLEARKKGNEDLTEGQTNELRSRLSLEADERERYLAYHMAGTELQRLTDSIVRQYEKHPDILKEEQNSPPKGLWNRLKGVFAPDRKLTSLLEAYDAKTVEYGDLRDQALHFAKEHSPKVYGGSSVREGGIGLGTGARGGAELFGDRPHKLEKDRAAELADREALEASGELTLEQQRQRYINAGISPEGAENLLALGEFGTEELSVADKSALEKLQEGSKIKNELKDLREIAEAYIQDIRTSSQFNKKDLQDLRDAVTNLRMRLSDLEGADNPAMKVQRKETWDAMMKFKKMVDELEKGGSDLSALTNEAVAEVAEKADFEAMGRAMFAARKSLEGHQISLKEAQTVMKEFEGQMAKQNTQSTGGDKAFRHAYEIFDELKESVAIYSEIERLKKELTGKKPDLAKIDTDLEKLVNHYTYLERDSAFQEVDRKHHELWEANQQPGFETAWKLMDTISSRAIALSKQMKQMPVGQLGPIRAEARKLRTQLEGLANNNAHLPDDRRYQVLMRDVKQLERYGI